MNESPVSIEYHDEDVRRPPTSWWEQLAYLGPGIIIAGSIVGAGELIATTSTGAVAGFSLLWLILLGCIIKVFVQVELGKHAVLTGKGTMQALSEMPGPRIGGVNWALGAWFIMFIAGIFSLGAVLSGIGQAMALVVPVTAQGQADNLAQDRQTQLLLDTQESLGRFLTSDSPNEQDLDWPQPDREKWRSALSPLLASDAQWTAEWTEMTRLVWLENLRRDQRASLMTSGRSLSVTRQTVERMDALGALIEARQADLNDRLPQQDLKASAQAAWQEVDRLQTRSYDAGIWGFLIGIASLILLLTGRFRALEIICLVLVGLFTLATIANLFLLQSTQWHIRAEQFLSGLRFRLPADTGMGSFTPLATALMTFGIIGVGAAELLAYPYWCLEKGYARFTGRPENSEAWTQRASGWLKVLRLDAWSSMVVYTFSTIVFYLLGAAVLHPLRIAPSSSNMVRSLAIMFEPTMGEFGKVMFLFGSVAVLYSTFLVATASHSKTAADAFRVAGLIPSRARSLQTAYNVICAVVTLLVLVLVASQLEPTRIILIGGFFQALMLPVLAATAIYFRYRRNTVGKQLESGFLWDSLLWLSSAGMFVCGIWGFYLRVEELPRLLLPKPEVQPSESSTPAAQPESHRTTDADQQQG